VGGKTFALYRVEDDPFCSSASFMQWLRSTPFITEIELEFALEAVRHERLGQRGGTDLLTISLSANDYIGHAFGPDSPQVADMVLQTDKLLAGFFSEINSLVGLENVWIALSADHGVAPTPRWIKEHRLGRGNTPMPSTRDIAQEALARAFGREKWLEAAASRYLYLNRAALASKKVDLGKAEEAAAQALRQSPGVAAAFTRTQLAEGTLPQTALSAQAIRNFDAERAGEILVLLEPYALPGLPDDQATHGSPWDYDAQVPLILWGRAFKRGTYEAPCQTVDLVPTLFAALGLASPSGVEGRPLGDALQGSSGRLGTPTSENDSPDSPSLRGNP
jgi:arylsulfatase A-like enzyme